MERQPTFKIGNTPVYGDVILAPMAGYADVPHRAVCRAYGSAVSYTEFVPAEVLQGKRNDFWRLLDFQPAERPMIFQIFGNNPQMILRAAQNIEQLGPDAIDVNMGCSTRKVSGRGAGVGMMRDPGLVAETFRLLTHHLSVPVTGKIRLGWDDHQNYLEIGRILEANGASLIAIHPRTKEQKYGGEARWQAIAELKQAVSIPVVGCGDVRTPADIERMKRETGCDGVMIGRGAIGNPWIFARRPRHELAFTDITALIRQHLAEMLAYHGDPYGLILFRKHLTRYLAGITAVEPCLKQMIVCKNAADFYELLAEAEAAVAAQGWQPADLLPLDESASCDKEDNP
jgi:tRNA-dihydrouridine synthase B